MSIPLWYPVITDTNHKAYKLFHGVKDSEFIFIDQMASFEMTHENSQHS